MPISQQIGSSSLAKPGVCTSTTRPATPYDGMVIYETDTDKTLVWNGSAWVYLSTSTAGDVGLVKVVPTSVSSAGGTAATLSADGTVTIGNGNTTVSLNGCFSSLYSYYVINAKTAFSTTTNAIFRLRSGGTDNATAWYGSVSRTQANSTAATITNYNGNLSWVVTDNQSSTTYLHLTVYDPFIATNTMTTMTGTGVGTTSFQYTGGSYHGLLVSYDGFSLYPNGTTYTGGTITVYGYRN